MKELLLEMIWDFLSLRKRKVVDQVMFQLVLQLRQLI
jgi:hypothetical protein